MTRILIAGYQHETNTFAPSLADWAAFNTGESFPAYMRGQAVIDQLTGVNIPVGGFMDAARRAAGFSPVRAAPVFGSAHASGCPRV